MRRASGLWLAVVSSVMSTRTGTAETRLSGLGEAKPSVATVRRKAQTPAHLLFFAFAFSFFFFVSYPG